MIPTTKRGKRIEGETSIQEGHTTREKEDFIKRGTIAGIDVGGHYIKFAPVHNGRVGRVKKVETNREDVMSSLFHILDNFGEFQGISVGFPGFVQDGVVKYPPNFPAIDVLPVKKLLEERYRVPVVVENDANLHGLGEYVSGAGKESRIMVLLTLGTGVGGAVIIDGKLHKGFKGYAGEMGHIIIDPNGPMCGCGMRGCLEAYVGAERILETFIGFRKKGFDSLLDYPSSVKEIYRAAEKGDGLSAYIFKLVGNYVGIALVTTVNILDPEVIVIGGGISGAWKFIKPGIMEEMEKRLIEVVPVKKGVLGDRAGLIGGWYLLSHG